MISNLLSISILLYTDLHYRMCWSGVCWHGNHHLGTVDLPGQFCHWMVDSLHQQLRHCDEHRWAGCTRSYCFPAGLGESAQP